MSKKSAFLDIRNTLFQKIGKNLNKMKTTKTILNLLAILVLIIAVYALVDGIKARSNQSPIASPPVGGSASLATPNRLDRPPLK